MLAQPLIPRLRPLHRPAPRQLLGGRRGQTAIRIEGRPYTTIETSLVKRYVEASNIGKTGACHLFRHTMATLMLEGGADVRYIQQMLGHSRLETTEVYTHVSIRTLKAVHSATHPARLRRTTTEPRLLPPALECAGAFDRTSEIHPSSDDDDPREDLLLSLAAEAAEEEHSLAASHCAG